MKCVVIHIEALPQLFCGVLSKKLALKRVFCLPCYLCLCSSECLCGTSICCCGSVFVQHKSLFFRAEECVWGGPWVGGRELDIFVRAVEMTGNFFVCLISLCDLFFF